MKGRDLFLRREARARDGVELFDIVFSEISDDAEKEAARKEIQRRTRAIIMEHERMEGGRSSART